MFNKQEDKLVYLFKNIFKHQRHTEREDMMNIEKKTLTWNRERERERDREREREKEGQREKKRESNRKREKREKERK